MTGRAACRPAGATNGTGGSPPAAWRAGDVEVETFMLRQGYVYEGTRYDIVAPTTMVWRREGDTWTVALIHTVPLPPAT